MWRAFDAAQRFYEADVQSFTNRINLFLAIESALLAVVVTSIVGQGDASTTLDPTAVPIFGMALSVIWLVVSISSYSWIVEWRRELISAGRRLRDLTGVTLPLGAFLRSTQRAWLPRALWYLRPTLWTGLLPLLYIAAWTYLMINP